MKVKQAMHKAVVIEGDVSLKNAARIMAQKNIGCLIVIKKDKIIGIVTERDVLRNLGKLNHNLSSVMSKRVISIDVGESIDNAAVLMSRHKIKRLPVTKKGKLTGIITVTDLISNVDSLGEDFLFE